MKEFKKTPFDKVLTIEELLKKEQRANSLWKKFCRNKSAVIGLIIVGMLILAALTAPILAPYDPEELDLRNKYGMNIAGIRINNHMNLQFSPDEKLQKEMRMYVIGKDKDLQHFNG